MGKLCTVLMATGALLVGVGIGLSCVNHGRFLPPQHAWEGTFLVMGAPMLLISAFFYFGWVRTTKQVEEEKSDELGQRPRAPRSSQCLLAHAAKYLRRSIA